jgi:transcriptional regulator with XRE-family HTH domain
VVSAGEDVARNLDTQAAIVGARLRRLRRARGLTLQRVAAQVGLSPSFLSMLERGQADVSLSRFRRLATFYGSPMTALLVEGEFEQRPRELSPEGGLRIERGQGITYRLLPSPPIGVQMIHVRFDPYSEFDGPLTHDGVDLCWVLSGKLELLFGGDVYPVRAGRAIVYPAQIQHSFRNSQGKHAELLGITTPPYW